LKDIPKLPLPAIVWNSGGAGYKVEVGEKIFLGFPKSVVAADGNRVLIHNPQTDNNSRYTLERRAQHLMMYSGSENAIDPQKAKFMPNIVQTLENAQFILRDPETGNFLYGARYPSNLIHLVIVSPKQKPGGPDAVSRFLTSQFVFDGGGRQKGFQIVWVCPDKNEGTEPDKKIAPDGNKSTGGSLSESC